MKVDAIFGPPGTGKTRTLVEMASDKKNVAMFSYTKAAAQETASRLPNPDQVLASTIHSVAFNRLGVSRASIVDAPKIAEFSKATGLPFKGVEKEADTIQEGDEYMSVLSFARNRFKWVMEAYEHYGCPGTRHKFELFVKEYRQWKDTYGYVDFDDMLENFIDSRVELPHWEWVFLDEAQDCTPLQWRVFDKLAARSDNIIIAGDDDQAIYEWNGADPHGMINFLQANEGEMHILKQSHRIPARVHEFAHDRVLSQIERRVDKEFRPRKEVGAVIRYGDIADVPLTGEDEDVLVLTRDRFRMDEIKRMLNRTMIPYDVRGGHSPWTSILAQKIRNGEPVEWDKKNLHWKEFYRQADLSAPVNITLSTIHQAKGREADTVVLDLTLPARTLAAMYNDRDAELRVMYVAVTRARHELMLCSENPLI